jgi:hypothetical protein
MPFSIRVQTSFVFCGMSLGQQLGFFWMMTILIYGHDTTLEFNKMVDSAK